MTDLAPRPPGPGWYPDPWLTGASRYWDGNGWTAKVERRPTPAPWAAEHKPPRRTPRRYVLLSLVVAVSFIAGLLLAYVRGRHDASSQGLSADQQVLRAMSVRPADVPADRRVQLVQGGLDPANEPTLDLCNGTYASETQRISRYQVAVVDAQSLVSFSTEAVLYRNPAATALAFTELRHTAATCPTRPVASPIGGAAGIFKFNAPPDAAWPQTPGVERLAYDFTEVDDQGSATHSIAVYLRRGRVLEGLYFPQPVAQPLVIAGKSAIADVVAVFARRMAAVRRSVVDANIPRRF